MEIGSGDGAVTRQLATRVRHRRLVAIDVNPAMTAYARCVNSGPTIEYWLQDMGVPWDELSDDIRQLEGKVELIFANFSLHYILDKSRLLSICARLLSTGGSIHANSVILPDLNQKLPADERRDNYLSVDQQLVVWRQALADNRLIVDEFEVVDHVWRMSRQQLIGLYLMRNVI